MGGGGLYIVSPAGGTIWAERDVGSEGSCTCGSKWRWTAGSRPIHVREIGDVWLVSTAQVSENGGKAPRAAKRQARGMKWKPK